MRWATVVAPAGPARRRATPELVVPTAAELLGSPDERLELVLDRVVELEAVVVEDLEAVVVGRVVRRRDHDPGRELARAGEEGEGRRGHDADLVDVGAQARRAGGDRRHEHVAGAAGVLADDDRAAGRPTSRCAVARPRA